MAQGSRWGRAKQQARDRDGEAGADASAQREQQALAVEQLLEDGREAEHRDEQQRVAPGGAAAERARARARLRATPISGIHAGKLTKPASAPSAPSAAARAGGGLPPGRVAITSAVTAANESSDRGRVSDARARAGLRREQTPRADSTSSAGNSSRCAAGLRLCAGSASRRAAVVGMRTSWGSAPCACQLAARPRARGVRFLGARRERESRCNWEGTLSIEVLGFPPLAVTGGRCRDGRSGRAAARRLETLRIAASRGGIDRQRDVPDHRSGRAGERIASRARQREPRQREPRADLGRNAAPRRSRAACSRSAGS